MGKRSAETELNQKNWKQVDEKQEDARDEPFAKASEHVLQLRGRRIVRAKRPTLIQKQRKRKPETDLFKNKEKQVVESHNDEDMFSEQHNVLQLRGRRIVRAKRPTVIQQQPEPETSPCEKKGKHVVECHNEGENAEDINHSSSASFSQAFDDDLQVRRIVLAEQRSTIMDPVPVPTGTKAAIVSFAALKSCEEKQGEHQTETTMPAVSLSAPGEIKPVAVSPSSLQSNVSATTTPRFGSGAVYKGFGVIKTFSSSDGYSWGGTPTTVEDLQKVTSLTAKEEPSFFASPTLLSKTSSTPGLGSESPIAVGLAWGGSPTTGDDSIGLGEENEDCIMEANVKSFKFDWTTPVATEAPSFDGGVTPMIQSAPAKEWKYTGLGILRVLRDKDSACIRLVQRQKSTGSVLMNAMVETICRRLDSDIFEVNGLLAVQLNPVNADNFEALVASRTEV